jgi:hypothetical protein
LVNRDIRVAGRHHDEKTLVFDRRQFTFSSGIEEIAGYQDYATDRQHDPTYIER